MERFVNPPTRIAPSGAAPSKREALARKVSRSWPARSNGDRRSYRAGQPKEAESLQCMRAGLLDYTPAPNSVAKLQIDQAHALRAATRTEMLVHAAPTTRELRCPRPSSLRVCRKRLDRPADFVARCSGQHARSR